MTLPEPSDSYVDVDIIDTRPCGWCSRPIRRRRRHTWCGDRCRASAQDLAPRRFAYADPPYPGQAERYYGWHPDYAGEVDHAQLIDRLCAEFPDGWALSTAALSLRDVLPLCPRAVRVLAWVKPQLSLKPTAALQFGWEPVILHRGRWRDPMRSGIVKDYVSVSATRDGPLVGAKPLEFNLWVFRCAAPGTIAKRRRHRPSRERGRRARRRARRPGELDFGPVAEASALAV